MNNEIYLAVLRKIEFILDRELYEDICHMDADNDFKARNLFLPPFIMTPLQMCYLFFELEKDFVIAITEDDVLKGRLLTIRDIVDLIISNRECAV